MKCEDTGFGIQDSGARKIRRSAFDSILLLIAGLVFSCASHGGAQIYTPLSASVRGVLHRSVSDQAVPKLAFASQQEADAWLDSMSKRLEKRIPDAAYRMDFLKTMHYEATRAGLDPKMVLGLIEVESGFRKHAISSAGARGYMQVMPFWVKEIGAREHNLFHLRTNLRYGCTILRHYVDMEHGDLYRALGRYNGSLGKPEYPNMVRAAWHKYWDTTPKARGSLAAQADIQWSPHRAAASNETPAIVQGL